MTIGGFINELLRRSDELKIGIETIEIRPAVDNITVKWIADSEGRSQAPPEITRVFDFAVLESVGHSGFGEAMAEAAANHFRGNSSDVEKQERPQ